MDAKSLESSNKLCTDKFLCSAAAHVNPEKKNSQDVFWLCKATEPFMSAEHF